MDINKLWKNGQNARIIKVSGDLSGLNSAREDIRGPTLILNYFFLG